MRHSSGARLEVGELRPLPPPRCPVCQYDLTGAPEEVCPECGGGFSRDAVMRARYEASPDQPWPANWLLIASVFVGNSSVHFGSADRWVQPLIVGAGWALAALWVRTRRHAVRGDKPWLVLWLILVTAFAEREGHPELEAAGPWITLAVAVAAGIYVYSRSPAALARAVLWAAAGVGWLVGGMFMLASAASFIFEARGGWYQVFELQLPMGDANDLLMFLLGSTVLGLGFLARQGARQIKPRDL